MSWSNKNLKLKTQNISNQELEASGLQMKIENDRLREVSEVAKNQVEMFEGRKQEQNLEIVIILTFSFCESIISSLVG
jgi:hypothetical protein